VFNKTIDVVVKTHLQDIIENKIIEKASQPKEFKNIKIESSCPFSKFANKFNLLTIKTCDGMNTLFEKSLIIKSCSDYHFQSGDDFFNYTVPSNTFKINEHQHREIQVTPFKFYPKILFPAFISTKKDVQFLIHKAYYHSKNARIYPSGIIGKEFTPNIIFELEKNTEDFIDYLEPLVYVTAMTDKKIKVHYELITEQEFNSKCFKYEKRRFSRHTVTG
jgi:hypothetical protein